MGLSKLWKSEAIFLLLWQLSVYRAGPGDRFSKVLWHSLSQSLLVTRGSCDEGSSRGSFLLPSHSSSREPLSSAMPVANPEQGALAALSCGAPVHPWRPLLQPFQSLWRALFPLLSPFLITTIDWCLFLTLTLIQSPFGEGTLLVHLWSPCPQGLPCLRGSSLGVCNWKGFADTHTCTHTHFFNIIRHITQGGSC